MKTRQDRSRFAVPVRKSDSHKGQNGLVLVIGGSKDYVGAPALAGIAALRAGCDMVNIAAPAKAAWAINALSPDLITAKLDGDYIAEGHVKRLAALSKRFDAVLVGPGMTMLKGTLVNRILKAVAGEGRMMVVDADAVKLARISSLKNAIITPHAGEFGMFLDANNKKPLKRELAKKGLSGKKRIRLIQAGLGGFFSRGNIILLKGWEDLVIAEDDSSVISGGNAGMTVGGTGDILAGLCAGYAAQTRELFRSAGLASQNCKKIGDALLKKSNFGFGFISSDFLREIKSIKRRR